MSAFATWLATYVDEKGLDTEHLFEVSPEHEEGFWDVHMIPLSVVLEAARQGTPDEQAVIKSTLVMIDYRNGDPLHFFAHLAKALATAHARAGQES